MGSEMCIRDSLSWVRAHLPPLLTVSGCAFSTRSLLLRLLTVLSFFSLFLLLLSSSRNCWPPLYPRSGRFHPPRLLPSSQRLVVVTCQFMVTTARFSLAFWSKMCCCPPLLLARSKSPQSPSADPSPSSPLNRPLTQFPFKIPASPLI